ncbi:hypothetical protein [Natronoflexus pectinivorans]|uniref:Uncharacterized protein n=1 Tax=Natronoflexus pectinivorans TaxID=682526 RepID=A0A4R2GH36_9BACT|nr:hypothetical protein [Natronoflexus pectinivorans]TCO07689.1 hypothetical protein EV194_10773 [Natronoflexus pectinivorans]
MKRSFILSLFLAITITVWSQNGTIVLHPVVGDSISQKEKTDFLLFPEISDNEFVYGKIIKTENEYQLHYLKSNGEQFSLELDSVMLLQYHLNINKLQAYYDNQNANDTITNHQKILLMSSEIDINKLHIQPIDPRILDKLPYEARRRQHLRNSAIDRGLWGQDIDIYVQTSGYLEIVY